MKKLFKEFTAAQLAKLKKEYEPLRGKRLHMYQIDKMKTMLSKHSTDMLVKLANTDIPFLATAAKSIAVMKRGKKWSDFKTKLDMSEADELQCEACWDSHKQVGFKMKNGKRVPNCVPKEELQEVLDVFGSVYIEEGGRWMPLTEGYCKGHDLKVEEDMLFGRIGEEFTREIFEGNTKIEIKTERDIWKTTGNIDIEIRCKGKPSGISTTESSVWIHLLSLKGVIMGGFLFKVDQLKAKIKKLHNEKKLKMVMGGDDSDSQMALLPIKDLFN